MEIVFVRHGQSTANVARQKNKRYDPKETVLTSKGIKQAKKTGKFLKIFGKFDVVISSIMPRCIQTTSNIIKEINYKEEDVIYDKRLIEPGNVYNVLDGLTKEDRARITPKEMKDLEKKIEKEKNPFKRFELQKKYSLLREKKQPQSPTHQQAWNNYVKFLYWLKKQKYKRVLVVSHSVTMMQIMKILCNISIYDRIIKVKSDKSKVDVENCSVMCVKKIDTKLQLISATEDLHLVEN
jgi:broad specificity phosphatase PhoE